MKIACPACGQHIEVDAIHGGQETECPTCSAPFKIPVAQARAINNPPPMPPQATPQNTESARPPGQVLIHKYTDNNAGAMALQLIGLVFCLIGCAFWPMLLVGFAMLVAGGIASQKYRCGYCKTPLPSKDVMFCQSCRHQLLKPKFFG